MFLKYKLSRFLPFLYCSLLLSCGGGSISLEEIEEGSLYDLNSSETSALELITIDGSTLSLIKASGNFIRNEGSASVSIPDSTGNSNKLVSNAVPAKQMTSFVTIIPEGNALDGSFGILGLPTASNTIPKGTYNYSGNAQIFVNDGNALYGLSGNSNVVLEFDGTNSKITGDVTSLTGKRSFLDLSCRDCPVSSVLDIAFSNGSVCNGNRICLGDIELRNSNLDVPLSKSHVLSSDGTFFGPNSSELGAIFSVNDTQSGSIEIRGALTGKDDGLN